MTSAIITYSVYIPRTMVICTPLLSIYLSGNGLGGKILTQFGRLSLYLNSLSGSIFVFFFSCLSLYLNDPSGSICVLKEKQNIFGSWLFLQLIFNYVILVILWGIVLHAILTGIFEQEGVYCRRFTFSKIVLVRNAYTWNKIKIVFQNF